MDTRELYPGLWYWTAPHPDWKPENDKPGGWGRMVGSVYYEPPDQGASKPGAVVLIDPLAPPSGTPDAGRFWEALDRDVRPGARVAILIGNEYHGRSAQAVFDRFETRPGASVWAHETARGVVKVRVTDAFQGKTDLPGGVIAHPIGILSPAEVAYYIPAARALVVADALIGAGEGRVRVVPASWAPQDPAGADLYRREFRGSLRRLLDLPIERLIVSHGPPILEEAHSALAEALEAPAWGES